MKAHFTLLITVLPLFLLAQSKTALQISTGTGVSYLINLPKSSYHQEMQPGFQLQAGISHRIAPKLHFIGGIGYLHLNYRKHLNAGVLQWPSQNNNGQYDPTLAGEAGRDFRSSDQFLYTLAGVRWDFSKHFFWQNGLSGNYLIHNSSSHLVYRAGLNSSLGWQMALQNGFALFASTAFRFIYNPAFSGSLSQFNTHPASIFLEFGVSRNL